MKVRSAIRKLCSNCKIVRKGKRNYVYCTTNPRHKQRQGFSTVASPDLFGYQALYEQMPKIEVTMNNLDALYTEAAIKTMLFSNNILTKK